MYHGGTSYGFMNGQNDRYEITSYDYDAPIAEDGELKLKYFLFQNVIAKVNCESFMSLGTYPPFSRLANSIATFPNFHFPRTSLNRRIH